MKSAAMPTQKRDGSLYLALSRFFLDHQSDFCYGTSHNVNVSISPAAYGL